MIFLTNLGVTGILRWFILVLEWEASKEIHDSSRLKILEKIFANHFPLSDAEENNSSIRQKLQQPSFWEVILFCLLA